MVTNFYLFLDHFGLKTGKSLLPQQIIFNSEFENPLKQSTFNSTIALEKFFRSIALTMHLVSAATN